MLEDVMSRATADAADAVGGYSKLTLVQIDPSTEYNRKLIAMVGINIEMVWIYSSCEGQLRQMFLLSCWILVTMNSSWYYYEGILTKGNFGKCFDALLNIDSYQYKS